MSEQLRGDLTAPTIAVPYAEFSRVLGNELEEIPEQIGQLNLGDAELGWLQQLGIRMELNPLVKIMTKRQNTSYAVMAQRIEAQDSLDDFPTPPWSTRALIEHVLGGKKRVKSQVCLEPACGSGHMAKVLSEYFDKVKAADIHPYGYGGVHDFLATPHETNGFDWVITNPPFRLGEDFTLRALKLARRGVAMLTRTVFIESVGRYNRLFSVNQPSHFAQFTERVPMVKGRLDRRASTATGYCWLVWDKESSGSTQLVWIPPCRKALEREDDYELPAKPVSLEQF